MRATNSTKSETKAPKPSENALSRVWMRRLPSCQTSAADCFTASAQRPSVAAKDPVSRHGVACLLAGLVSIPQSFAQLSPPLISPPAQTQGNTAPLSAQAKLEAEYRSCPGGFYAGPRPGRTRYTRDTFTWAVTPAFAAKYCFPKEFISEELKGAEAVAVKIDESKDEIICGWGNNQEMCRPSWRHWRIELYVPTGALPNPKHRFFISNFIPSGALIPQSEVEINANRKYEGIPGAKFPFDFKQVQGIFGIREGKAVWHSSWGHLSQKHYFDRFTPNLDYLAISHQIGGLSKAYGKIIPTEFYITFHKPDFDGKLTPDVVSQSAHSIRLPQKLFEQMRNEDQKSQTEFIDQVKRSFSPTPSIKPNN